MQMTKRDLAPREAMERWLDSLRVEKSDQTVSTYYYRLKLFVEWCDEQAIDSMRDLDGWTLDSYETHRRSKHPSPSTMKNEFSTLKNWLAYCARIEVVDETLPEKVEVPTVDKADRSSDISLTDDAAAALLTYYRNSDEYAARGHTLLELLWHTGARVGAIQSLDVGDWQETESGQRYLLITNRPSQGTRLKKANQGERPVLLSETVWDVVDTYVRQHRHNVTDEYGREPLITSTDGRPAKGSLRDWTYQATIPCKHSDCPHGKDSDTCDWTSYNRASQCPSSRSPHQIRTGAITWMRNQGIPAEEVAQRVNASVETIEEHYDKQSAVDEMLERRAQYTADLDIQQEDNSNV